MVFYYLIGHQPVEYLQEELDSQPSFISSVQSLSHVRLFATPWTAACQASLSITNSQSLLILIPIELVIPSNHLILCHPLLLSPSLFPSTRDFSDESVLHMRWPKCWSFSFNISPSHEVAKVLEFQLQYQSFLCKCVQIASFSKSLGTSFTI